MIFFFNDTATTEIYTLSLHDALPILPPLSGRTITAMELDRRGVRYGFASYWDGYVITFLTNERVIMASRSEEHTSELQSRQYLVCRLLLEKKKPTSYTVQH